MNSKLHSRNKIIVLSPQGKTLTFQDVHLQVDDSKISHIFSRALNVGIVPPNKGMFIPVQHDSCFLGFILLLEFLDA